VHATSAGLKGLCSYLAAVGIEDCRKSCGGHGYLLNSGVASLSADYVWQTTAEGDFVVLLLQTARFLMKCFDDVRKGEVGCDFLCFADAVAAVAAFVVAVVVTVVAAVVVAVAGTPYIDTPPLTIATAASRQYRSQPGGRVRTVWLAPLLSETAGHHDLPGAAEGPQVPAVASRCAHRANHRGCARPGLSRGPVQVPSPRRRLRDRQALGGEA
jgi:hypothetical protein